MRDQNQAYAMKAKEAFQSIRNLRQRFSLKFRLIITVTFEIIISILLAVGVDALTGWLFSDIWEIPLLVDAIIIALFVGIFATNFLTRWFIDPIKKVGAAMGKIAEGDFSTRLNSKSSSKEIQEIYLGFNMMAQELQSTEILQSDFVSNVSHEFKTPINAIEGYSMLLQNDDNLTEEQKEYVEKIIFNTERLSSLTGSILLLSKLENQSIVSNKTQFDLDEQIRKSLLSLEPEWEKKEIEFDIEMDDTDFIGNEALLHHIWDNLISNAIKFSYQGGVIKIHLKNYSEKIIFTISDNGIGISDEAKNHIFDKFYQADSSHKQQGNGLGLALVKKIIDLENGEISVKNNKDKGCTFTVVLYK
jgi:signal transduction histidine kinase